MLPNGRLESTNARLAVGNLANDFCVPVAQSFDCGTLYARTATFFLLSFLASHASPTPARSKQRAPSCSNRFGGPVHSALTFQPNTGLPDLARRSAPAK